MRSQATNGAQSDWGPAVNQAESPPVRQARECLCCGVRGVVGQLIVAVRVVSASCCSLGGLVCCVRKFSDRRLHIPYACHSRINRSYWPSWTGIWNLTGKYLEHLVEPHTPRCLSPFSPHLRGRRPTSRRHGQEGERPSGWTGRRFHLGDNRRFSTRRSTPRPGPQDLRCVERYGYRLYNLLGFDSRDRQGR